MSEELTANALSQKEMNSYRLTSMEEPGYERMAQIMRRSPRMPAGAGTIMNRF